MAEGARLVAVCYLIDQAIGHRDAERDLNELAGMASEVGLSQEELDAMVKEVAESYQTDRGRSLLAAAFPDGADAGNDT